MKFNEALNRIDETKLSTVLKNLENSSIKSINDIPAGPITLDDKRTPAKEVHVSSEASKQSIIDKSVIQKAKEYVRLRNSTPPKADTSGVKASHFTDTAYRRFRSSRGK